MEAKANDARRQVKVVCPHDCPDTCVMTVAVEGDRAVALGGGGGVAAHRFTAGFLCAKVNRYLERVVDLREQAGEWPPERAAETTGLDAARPVARDYAGTHPSAIRLNYGLNRHAGGGMAVRTVSCLPAVVGAWRHPGGGVLLSTSGTFPVDGDALERPDLVPPGTRTLNMSLLGRILTDETLDPPVKALFVYNSNPAAVAPEQESVPRGLARDDLFTVVHELFQTDTVDFADVVLPATTTLEQYDIHKSYGHLYVSLSRPAIPPLGEALANTEVFRRLAARLDLDHPCLRDSDEEMARQAFDWDHPRMKGITFERLEREGTVRLNVPDPYVPFVEGGFPTASGKCELRSEQLGAEGHDPVAGYNAPRESVLSAPELAKRFPLALITPPAHHFLNSTFSAQPVFVRREGEAAVTLHPEDAASRSIVEGVCPGVRNANAVTSQGLTDMGGGATFYDVLVEVEPAA